MSWFKWLVVLILFFPCPTITRSEVNDSLFFDSIQNEDLLILSENLDVSFQGQKAEYIEVVFSKEIEYQILSDSIHSLAIELPENNDPTYRPHGSDIKNLSRLLDDVRINFFEVQLFRADGQEVSPAVKREEIQTRIVNDRNMFGYLYSYKYSITDVEKGDVVRIKYSYNTRYIYNYFRMFSYRMFLHDKYPRKEYKLTLSHHFDLEVDTFFMNNAQPTKKILENRIIYSWELANQPGCLDEPGSKPYVDLPWFTITIKPYELLYQDFNSFRETFVPMWYYLSARREEQLRKAVDDANLGTKDRDNLAFDKLAQRYINMTPEDSSGIDGLRLFQRFMVDSVRYENDFNYYNGDEGYLKDHPGIELTGNCVKDHLKDYVYASVLSKLGLQYFTAYVADSRSGAMSIEYYAPVYDNELLFAPILKNNTLAYLLPKSDCRNLYCEELPFYYENAPVLLIYTYDFAGYKRNFNELARIVNTPGSTHADNFRKINGMAEINLGANTIAFKTKISLSGQYSTLTRTNYTGLGTDSTVNKRYHKKVWEIGGEHVISELLPGQTDLYFPYHTSIEASYEVNSLINKVDDHFAIDVGKWTGHIIYEDFISEHRETDFYPDFLGSDSFAFMLVFDREVSLESEQKNISIENEFGIFTYNIRQVSPTKILLNSYFLTKQPHIKASRTSTVEEIYKSIETTEKTILEIHPN